MTDVAAGQVSDGRGNFFHLSAYSYVKTSAEME
jgi:hypothetical protein